MDGTSLKAVNGFANQNQIFDLHGGKAVNGSAKENSDYKFLSEIGVDWQCLACQEREAWGNPYNPADSSIISTIQ